MVCKHTNTKEVTHMTNNKVYNQAASLLNNTVNTRSNTTAKTMKTTKTLIAVNLNTTSIGLAQESNPESKVFMNVHNGSIKWNGRTRKVFIDFQPTPSKEGANFTPVFQVDAEGNRTEIDRVEFWADICGTNADGFVNTARIQANLDMTVTELKDLVESGAKALEFTFDNANAGTAFIFEGVKDTRSKKLSVSGKEALFRFGPAVDSDVTDHVILTDSTFLQGGTVLNAISNAKAVAPSIGIANVSAATEGVTVSSRRRAQRRADHEAAKTTNSAPSISQMMANAAPAPAPQAPAQSSTDAKLDAIMAMVGNLQTQVAELKAENAALRAENEALKAGAAPQSEAARASLDNTVEEATHVTKEAPKAPQSIEDCFDMFGEEMDEEEFDALPSEAQDFDAFDTDEEEDVDVFAPATTSGSKALV